MIELAMPEAEYHAHPAMSSTGAKKILETPADFKYWRDNPQPYKQAFAIGSAVHARVLGTGYEVVRLDFPDFRTKAAREARDKAHADGKIPLLLDEVDEVGEIAESVLKHPTASALLHRPGNFEASVFAEVDGIETRCRFDFLPDEGAGRRVAVDLKTTGTKAFGPEWDATVFKFGYHVSRAWYLETLAASTGEDDAEFVFVAVEKTAPYKVAVHQLTPQFDRMGREATKRARELFAECTATDTWPGYPDGINVTAPRVGDVYAHEEKYA